MSVCVDRFPLGIVISIELKMLYLSSSLSIDVAIAKPSGGALFKTSKFKAKPTSDCFHKMYHIILHHKNQT